MKTGRHARILDIIAEHPIETQDELLTRLVKTLGSDGNIAMLLRTAVQPISVPIFQIFSALR